MKYIREFIDRSSFGRTVRARLLLSAILVEAVMLLLLVSNSLRLIHENMTTQERRHANELAPVLIAALVAPMAQRDYATVQAVLHDSKTDSEVDYLVVTNSSGTVVASAGWDESRTLPQADKTFDSTLDGRGNIYQSVRPIKVESQQLGTLHFGLDLSPIISARRAMLTQGITIALIELVLSICMLTFIGIWLTRHLAALARVSQEVADGNLSPAPLPEGRHDIGQLCAAFNAMSRAVAERVNELTYARDFQNELTEIIKQEQSRMTALLKAMDIGVMLLDMNGRIIYENPAFRTIFAIPPEVALTGLTGREVLAETAPEFAQDAVVAPCVQAPPDGSAREMQVLGSRVVSERIHVVTSDDGAIIGHLYLFEDITASKQIAQQLISAKEAAEASRKTQAAFLATMSHEIRTPMNGIIGMTNLVSSTQLNAEQQEYMGWIKASAESLLTVLNDILDYSKIDSGQMSLESIPFSLTGLLDEVVGMHKTLSSRKNIALSWDADGDVPGVVIGDPVRLRQILTNLVSNAVKFTQQGTVSVSVSADSPSGNGLRVFRFAVADTGIGIPEALREQIFSPFLQADNSIARKFGGTGLGLAIVRRLVGLLGGDIRVESEVGRGSEFVVTIPLDVPSAASAVAAAGKEKLADAGSIGRRRILLAEDTPVNQRLGQLLLSKLGHDVILAEDGFKAVDAFLREKPDLILMDMQMPEMDGLEATQRIRKLEKEGGTGSHVPIVALTANAMQSDRTRCIDAGMDDYIAKPFKPDQIVAILQVFLS